MPLTLNPAIAEDAAEIAALRSATAEHLTEQFGKGHWSSASTEKGVLFAMRMGTVYIARRRGKLIASATLSTRKPWAIDKSYFTPCRTPLYLTAMAVAVKQQRTGVGQAFMAALPAVVRSWPADAIRLDAYDPPAGAGDFYRKCGLHEVGRVVYKGAPLIYFELL